MDETVLLPSPNWFHVSGFAVAPDGWIAYGGPSRSLCILEPLDQNRQGFIQSRERFQSHFLPRANAEKITSVEFSPEWPEKRFLLTGSLDGSVKQWNVECLSNNVTIKCTHSHYTHHCEKEEVIGVSYSTETVAVTAGNFGSIVKWNISTSVTRNYGIILRKFKPTCIACSKFIPLMVAVGTKQGVIFVLDLTDVKGKVVYKVRAHDDDIYNVSWCPQYEVVVKKFLSKKEKKTSISKRLERQVLPEELEVDLNKSGTAKNLPDDSFDETIVEEDNTFDIYKDHEADEFGHKKYVPEDIIVEVKEENETDDFLAECLKLKEDILKRKHEESSIANLVEALDKTHMDSESSTSETPVTNDDETDDVFSIHIQKHLLASIGKLGLVKIWSKTGKQISSCFVNNTGNNKKQKQKVPYSSTILWYKPDILLIADGMGHLLECNPLNIESKNRFRWNTVHALHKRGLFCIASNASRILTSDQPPEDHWRVYTVAQDRNIVSYSMERRETIAVHNTTGGFLYNSQWCPYDAKKVAVSVGDGAIRVWEADLSEEDETKLCQSKVTTFWQNVQGKVLTVAWHPTKENLLAFSTAESRIGIIDTSGKSERPARNVASVFRGGIYCLYWGEHNDLYACGGGEVFVYKMDKREKDPEQVKVEVEGVTWKLTAISWHSRGILFGSDTGAVALLTHKHEHVAHAFPFNKMIHKMEWHPQQISSSFADSPYKDLIALSSMDKSYNVVILQYSDKEEDPKLNTWKVLSGHTNIVLDVAWNPHKDGLLLSTSQDSNIRVWDVIQGTCVALFGHHTQSSMGATWSAFPQLSCAIFSGGADCCLRVWNYEDHPPEAYTEIKHVVASKNEKKKKIKEELEEKKKTPAISATDFKKKCPKRFLLPNLFRQFTYTLNILKIMVNDACDKKKLENGEEIGDKEEGMEEKPCEIDYTNVFGTTNEVNKILDLEMQMHLENSRYEAYFMLCMFRGHIDTMIKVASEKDMLCPFLVSLTPCVSFKYWKDVTQLFLAQIERLNAKNEANKIFESKYYGGVIIRKVAIYLSVHDVTRAINTLMDVRLFKEAYLLARARHMNSIAEDIAKRWAMEYRCSGNLVSAAVCYLGLGEINNAISTLAQLHDQEYLKLAAKLAKTFGQTSYATHIQEKIQSESSEEELKPLPSKIDAMKIGLNDDTTLYSDDDVNGDSDVEGDNDPNGDNDVNGDSNLNGDSELK